MFVRNLRTVWGCALAALAAAVSPSHAAVIADSATDFSGTQGGNGWYYGYVTSTGPLSAFTQFSTYSGTYWSDATPTATVYAAQMDATLAEYATRRWTNSIARDVTINLHVNKIATGGNGINSRVYLNSSEEYQNFLDGNNTAGFNAMFTKHLLPGDNLYFIVDPLGNSTSDSVSYMVQISDAPTATPEPAALALFGLGLAGICRRRKR